MILLSLYSEDALSDEIKVCKFFLVAKYQYWKCPIQLFWGTPDIFILTDILEV